MGGYGSTRWAWHNTKTQVEDCRKMTIISFKPYLCPGYLGSISWKRGNRETGSISYQVIGGQSPESIRLLYTVTDLRTGEKTDCDYSIQLQTTPLPWGGVRYWFTCPLVRDNWPCQRRVGALYLPPGAQYFGCRHCYNLTYQSAQEKGEFDGLYRSLAASMQESHPGITAKDVKYILEQGHGKAPGGFYERAMRNYSLDYIPPDHRAGYLTADELCQQSDLSLDEMGRLESARLLLPDTKDGLYRPKLVSWARKLKYLLDEGWEMDETKMWAKERWSNPDPRQWPPLRW
jgi:hypothetical protein